MSRNAIKILAGVLLVGVGVLAAIALSASSRAEYWSNYAKTSAARAARHSKKEETQTGDETPIEQNQNEESNSNI
jgi:hypothetical protein